MTHSSHLSPLHSRFEPTAKHRQRSTLAMLTLAMAMLGSSGCDGEEPTSLDELAATTAAPIDEITPARELDPDGREVVVREPDLVLELEGGSHLGFMIDEDGIGMLEEVPKSAGVASVLDDPWLSDASPAMVWYALSQEEIPAPLRAHHEALAANGELAPLDEALAAQVRNLAPVPLADETSPCLNATFDVNHCDHPDYDDAVCFFNTNGNYAWNVPDATRYKAGFCLQAGEARSWLSYWNGAGSDGGECLYFRTDVFAWGADSYWNGDRYVAETYRSYVWWASPGQRRVFFHRVIGDPGAVFDWGTRYSMAGCG
jgi:hypothetical protein